MGWKQNRLSWKKKKLKQQTQNSNLQKWEHLLDMGNKKTLGPTTEGVAWGSHVAALWSCPYFRLLLVSVVWKTLEADMRFSMYWPRTWFSDFNFRFSSLTASTLADRSEPATRGNRQYYKDTSEEVHWRDIHIFRQILSTLNKVS